jgi:hypothetical protein
MSTKCCVNFACSQVCVLYISVWNFVQPSHICIIAVIIQETLHSTSFGFCAHFISQIILSSRPLLTAYTIVTLLFFNICLTVHIYFPSNYANFDHMSFVLKLLLTSLLHIFHNVSLILILYCHLAYCTWCFMQLTFSPTAWVRTWC